MNQTITKLLLLAALSFPMAGCSDDAPTTSAQVAATDAAPKVQGGTDSDGEKYANWKCRLPKEMRSFLCVKNDTLGKKWSSINGGKDEILAWHIAMNDDNFTPPSTTHSSEIPVGIWYAYKPKDGNFKLP